MRIKMNATIRAIRGAKFCIWVATVVLVGMIGLSRIYLGVHYPSDVIAGYCAAAVWVGAVGFLDRTLRIAEGEKAGYLLL